MGEVGQPGKRLLTATGENDVWVGTKNVVFCSTYNAATCFSKSTKDVFKVQRIWHSPNTLATVYDSWSAFP